MKRLYLTLSLLFSTLLGTQSQELGQQQIGSNTVGFVQGERDSHSRQWLGLTSRTNEQGQVITITNQAYIELATGLNHRDPATGQWVESKEQIDILPGGGAAATNGAYQVAFPADISSGAIEITGSDGVVLQNRPLGLSYFDGTNSVLFAELINSVGQILPSGNQVIYTNAFTDIQADLLCTYRKGGFECDIVFRQQPPAPEQFGLNSQNSRLQLLTEFFDTADPQQRVGPTNSQDSLADTTLQFGVTRMGHGKAFVVGDSSLSIPVYKEWVHLNGRTFLIEELPYQNISAQLQILPHAQNPPIASLRPALHRVSRSRLLPLARSIRTGTNSIQIARSDLSRNPGVVLDYTTVNGNIFDGYTFRGDTTYFISDTLYIINGDLTIEGGAVIKFARGGTAYVYADGDGASSVICKTGPYRPAIFTAMDDNSVGQAISGSTGNPNTNSYAAFGLFIDFGGPGDTLQYLRIAYAGYGMGISATGSKVRHCQFVNTGNGIQNACFGTPYLQVENSLFSGVSTIFEGASGSNSTIQASHLTVHDANKLNNTGTVLRATNSLFICVTNWGASFTSFNNATNNTTDAGIFQSAGAGYHYLAANSTNRNVGTTNISAALLADLLKKTTYAPSVMTNAVTTNTIFSPGQVQLDTDAPDLGYHYDPIDAFVSCTVSNATLTLTNGFALAYNYSDWVSGGIGLKEGSQLVSGGLANQRDYVVYYANVQEGVAPTWYTGGGLPSVFNLSHTDTSRNPSVNLRFTTIVPGNSPGRELLSVGSGSQMSNLTLRDCEIYFGGTLWEDYNAPTNAVYSLMNNLLVHAAVDIETVGARVTAYNNLMTGSGSGYFYLVNNGSGLWTNRDNVFDGCDTYFDGITNDHNAYLNNATIENTLLGSDIVVSNYTWVSGPLGDYYQPTNTLVNHGSRYADQAGLYHYTVLTNVVGVFEIKETNSLVDIGYHYVAIDGSVNPLDTDGDGLADYIEDSNGNGTYAAGDLSDWMTFSTDGTTISDGWEVKYFGHISIDPNADADGDGINNLQEYLLGTNPIVDDSSQSTSRLNYIYDPSGWLQQVTGVHSGTLSSDSEGNVQQTSQ